MDAWSRADDSSTSRMSATRSRWSRAMIGARRRAGGSHGGVREGGRTPAGLDGHGWARDGVERGAGEILLTSLDRDGTRGGQDLEVAARAADAVRVPAIASGGAGETAHF